MFFTMLIFGSFLKSHFEINFFSPILISDNLRALVVWIMSLAFQWEIFNFWQPIGFSVGKRTNMPWINLNIFLLTLYSCFWDRMRNFTKILLVQRYYFKCIFCFFSYSHLWIFDVHDWLCASFMYQDLSFVRTVCEQGRSGRKRKNTK